ncbi:MAG: hypothetical protein Q4E57_10625 [Eubacteriales bacterium]|nr:hypothetical protein [Eubacteriales bacterium]
MENKQETMEKINPVVLTAKATLNAFARMGDPDAAALSKSFQSDALAAFASLNTPMQGPISDGFLSIPEARFEMIDAFIQAENPPVVLDLPCGYTTRGLRMARTERTYIGADLPAAVAEMGPAVESLLDEEQKKRIRYVEVDGTNYTSLQQALNGINDSVLITTEGLLSYFTDDELEACVHNVRQLLLHTGGCWISPDREIAEFKKHLFNVIIDGDQGLQAQFDALSKRISSVADSKLGSNVLFSSALEESINWMRKRGLIVERVPIGKLLPDLKSLGNLREGIVEELRATCGDICLWKMTADRSRRGEEIVEQEFRVDVSLGVYMEFSGRMDTLTGMQTLEAFKKKSVNVPIREITVDFSKLEFLSTAGLRTLELMLESVKDGRMHIVGCPAHIRKVLIGTPFEQCLTD